MSKGKSTWKYNKLLTARRNYFVGGGVLDGLQNLIDSQKLDIDTKSALERGLGPQGNGTKPSNTNWAGIGTAAAAGAKSISGMIGSIMGKETDARKKQLMSGVNAVQSQGVSPTNDSFDTLMADYNAYSKLGHVTKEDLGGQSGGAVAGSALTGAASGAAAGASFGPWGAAIGGAVGGLTSLAGSLFGNNKAKNAAKAVNAQIDYTNDFNERSLANRGVNLMNSQMADLQANYAAFGGELNTHGADFTNGLLSINNGGSHETNPFEGVPMGVDQEGTPNLVEEGETVFNDYVFSKRLKVPKAIRSKYKLGGPKPISFAEASKRLAKESEERPNDPISQNGLKALMAELANTQDSIKSSQEGTEFAFGGNLFKRGGKQPTKKEPKQPWKFNNTKNDSTMASHELFAPFFKDNAFDFSAMHADNSTYRQRLDRLASILYKRKNDANYQYTDDEKKILEGYWNNVRSWNDGKGYDKGIDELSYDKIIGDSLTTTDGKTFTFNPNAKKKGLALDGMRGGHYYGATGVDPYEIVEEHMLMGKDGSLSKLPEEQRYWVGRRQSDSRLWDDLYSKTLKREDEGRYTEYLDKENNKMIRRYLYSPIEEDKKKAVADQYYYNRGTKDKPDYVLYEGEDAPLWMANNKYSRSRSEVADGVNKFFYDAPEEYEEGKYNDWLRYAPAVGFGIGTISDSLGLTNKPDYSNADAILEAARTKGVYQPVKFKPIGNYLSYNPFDRDYYINKQNAEAGATRRALLDTTGGNRGTAAAGLLAADRSYIDGIGALARQGEEYNLAQRQAVEDFNRATNMTNSQGFLQADIANQKARMDLGEFTLKGTMAGAELREKARLTADAARSANLSGLFQTFGDIGFEEANKRMIDWGIGKGIWGPGTEGYTWSKGRSREVPSNNRAVPGRTQQPIIPGTVPTPTDTNPYTPVNGLDIYDNLYNGAAKGGKIKRRKKRGLTY